VTRKKRRTLSWASCLIPIQTCSSPIATRNAGYRPMSQCAPLPFSPSDRERNLVWDRAARPSATAEFI
jgi:hypothetical protein